MDAIVNLRGSELDRLFADWGQPLILRRVERTFSPATGDVSETHQDFLITAVVKEQVNDATRRTAMRHATRELEFVLRSEELPPGIPLAAARLVHDGREFSVAAWRKSADAVVIVVQGQST